MEVRCEQCQARYRIDDSRIGPQGVAMRCAKCGSTFRIAPPAPARAAAAQPASPPAPARPARPQQGTMIFAAPPAQSAPPPVVAAPATPSPATAIPTPKGAPAASQIPAPEASAAPVTASPIAPPKEAPARSRIAPPPSAAPALARGASTDAAGRTMMFSAVAQPAAPVPTRPPAAPPPAGAGARTTQLFGPPPAVARIPDAPPPLFGAPAAPVAAATAPVLFAQPPVAPTAQSDTADDAPDPAPSEPAEPAAPRGPPRALLVGVAAALAFVLVAAGVAVVAKKWLHRAPPAAAVEALAQAQDLAAKDTMTSLVQGESRARAAAELVPRGYAAALAELAAIRVAQVDAFYDESVLASERARRETDDRKRALAEVLASDLQERGKARLKLAFEAAAAANRLAGKSPEVALALADYYRASRSRTNLARELKRAESLGAPPARLAFIEGADLLADENPAPAIEKLKAAAAAAPHSARERFRLAMALVSAQKQAEALRELQETLRLSPEHERAKATMEALAAGAPAGAAKQ